MIDKDEIREIILGVASEIFARYGFNKTTMDDIARGMGKGKSSIYYYFKNKEDIFREVVEKEVVKMKTRTRLAMEKESDPREKLRVYIQVRMQGFENFLNLYAVLKTEFLSHFDFVEQIRQKYDKEETSIIKGILDEGIKAKMFIIEDTYLTALAIFTAMKGMEIPLFTANHSKDQDDIRFDKLMDVLFYGIMKR